MAKTTILLILAVFNFLNPLYALDYKDLHNRAIQLTLNAAQNEVIKQPDVYNQYLLALVYLNSHQDQAAGEIFSQLLRADPDFIPARWGQAEVLRRRHATAQAEHLLNQVLAVDPRFAPALISLAYLKYFQQDFKGSIHLARRVIAQGLDAVDLNNFAQAYSMYAGAKGMLAHYGGVLSKAVDGLAVKVNLDKAYKLQPNSAAVLFGLGSFYLLAPVIAGGDKLKAQDFLTRAIQADPYFADVYVRLGQLAQANGDLKQYDFYLQKALTIDPQNQLAQDVLSRRCNFICLDTLD